MTLKPHYVFSGKIRKTCGAFTAAFLHRPGITLRPWCARAIPADMGTRSETWCHLAATATLKRETRPWRVWLLTRPDGEVRANAIQRYIEFCEPCVMDFGRMNEIAPLEMRHYVELRQRVLQILTEADELALEIRRKVAVENAPAALFGTESAST